MKVGLKIYLIVVIVSVLSACFFKEGKGENTITPHPEGKALASDLYVLEGGETEKEYSFEPEVSVIEGTLITRMYYGPPGYGENPDTDAKAYPFILQLDDPIQVIAQADDIINADSFDVIEIQIVPINKEDTEKISQYINQRVKIQGTLTSAVTGHHRTDVLMVMEKIIE